MAGFEKTAKTPRAGRFPPPRRGPRCRSRLSLLTALDAARRPCLHDLASSTAVRLLGFVAQTKKPAFRRRLRPRSRSGRHSCRPARAPPRQLSVDTRRPCTCNPKTKRTITPHVDNSLITSRIEYSTFLNLPLDECIVNTPQTNQE